MTKQIPLIECWDFVGTTPEKFDGEKRYISTGALDCDHVNEADVEMVTFASRPSRANLVVATGDIIFAKMASTEKTFVIDEVASEDIYSTGFCAVRADITKILPKCLYYFLASSLFLDQKDKNASGATQKAITNAGLAKIIINIPTLDEQRTFVAQMDLLCEAITARREQLAKLDELVKSRFIKLFGDPATNEKGWVIRDLENATTVVTYGLTVRPEYISEGIDLVSARELHKGYVDYNAAPKISENDFAKLSEKGKPQKNDILFSKTGSIGHCALVTEEKPFAITQNAARIGVKTEAVNPLWLLYYLRMDYIQDWCKDHAKGNAVKDFQLQDMKVIPLFDCPLELQNQFAAFVEQTDKSKLAIQESLAELETLKKALMQKYFG